MENALPEKAETKRKEIKNKIAKDAEAYEGDNKQYNTQDINAELKEMLMEMGFMVRASCLYMFFWLAKKLLRLWAGLCGFSQNQG